MAGQQRWQLLPGINFWRGGAIEGLTSSLKALGGIVRHSPLHIGQYMSSLCWVASCFSVKLS